MTSTYVQLRNMQKKIPVQYVQNECFIKYVDWKNGIKISLKHLAQSNTLELHFHSILFNTCSKCTVEAHHAHHCQIYLLTVTFCEWEPKDNNNNTMPLFSLFKSVCLCDSVWIVKTVIYCSVYVCVGVPVPPWYEQTHCNMLWRIPCRERSTQQFIIAWLPYACETVGSNLVQIHLAVHVPPHSIFTHSTVSAVYCTLHNNQRCLQLKRRSALKSSKLLRIEDDEKYLFPALLIFRDPKPLMDA